MLTQEALRLRTQIDSLSPQKRRRLLEKAGLDAARDWILWLARREQLRPQGSWLLWLICSGRGWGKTRAAAECIRQWVEEGAVRYFALIGPTARQTRDVMIEGESGILSVFSALPDKYRPKYEPSNCQLKFHNGAIAYVCSADQPDRLRGLEFEKGWFDEVSTWRRGLEAWNNALMGLRVGECQQVIATMTPRPNTLTAAVLKGELVSPDRMVITRGSSYENTSLPKTYADTVLAPYVGTRLGRQEIFGEFLTDVPGALWTYDMLDDCHVEQAPDDLVRVVVAIDPAVSVSEGSAETGLVAVAKGANGHGYVLRDGSGKFTPNQWAERARAMKRQFGADCYIAEANNGGNLVEEVLRSVDPLGKIVKVYAAHGKQARAEPVSLLYERRLMHHVDPFGNAFRALEDQMATFVPGAATSPDRMDALVWACHELFLNDEQVADYSMYNAENVARFEDYAIRQLGVSPEAFIPPGLRRWPW